MVKLLVSANLLATKVMGYVLMIKLSTMSAENVQMIIVRTVRIIISTAQIVTLDLHCT